MVPSQCKATSNSPTGSTEPGTLCVQQKRCHFQRLLLLLATFRMSREQPHWQMVHVFLWSIWLKAD